MNTEIDNLTMDEALKRIDEIIREDTRIFCTHINHKHDWNHEAYQEWFDTHTEFNVKVAYDGLKVDWNS